MRNENCYLLIYSYLYLSMFDCSISIFDFESGKYDEIRFKKFDINYGLYNAIRNLILAGKGKE